MSLHCPQWAAHYHQDILSRSSVLVIIFQIQIAPMANWKHGLCDCCSPINMMCKPWSSKLHFSLSQSSSLKSLEIISTENPYTSSIVTMAAMSSSASSMIHHLCHHRHHCRLLCHILLPLRHLRHGRGTGAGEWGRAPDIVVIIIIIIVIMSIIIKGDHHHHHHVHYCQRWSSSSSLSKVMQVLLGCLLPIAPFVILRGKARQRSGIEVGLSFFFFWL